MRNAESDFRRQLLATVSVLALFTSVGIARAADDADGDHPAVWIELGGISERQTGQSSTFVPPFVTNNLNAPAFQGFNLRNEKAPLYTNGAEAKITFEPYESSWVFSASVLFGRTDGSKNVNHVTAGHPEYNRTVFKTYTVTPGGYYSRHFHCCNTSHYTPIKRASVNMQALSRQSHAIIDFQAGRDLGLGLFGSSSVVNAGVRFAQFTSRVNIAIHALPDVEFQKHSRYAYGGTLIHFSSLPQFNHLYSASAQFTRSFHGVGPAISWNGSTPLLGNSQKGEIVFDWGANAAVLFGRQTAVGKHQTYQIYRWAQSSVSTHYTHSGSFNRRRTVTVPNVGGLAGISFRYSNAKISIGYRGDFFFGAMDTGNDIRKTETVGFYGPFASISVGLGG